MIIWISIVSLFLLAITLAVVALAEFLSNGRQFTHTAHILSTMSFLTSFFIFILLKLEIFHTALRALGFTYASVQLGILAGVVFSVLSLSHSFYNRKWCIEAHRRLFRESKRLYLVIVVLSLMSSVRIYFMIRSEGVLSYFFIAYWGVAFLWLVPIIISQKIQSLTEKTIFQFIEDVLGIILGCSYVAVSVIFFRLVAISVKAHTSAGLAVFVVGTLIVLGYLAWYVVDSRFTFTRRMLIHPVTALRRAHRTVSAHPLAMLTVASICLCVAVFGAARAASAEIWQTNIPFIETVSPNILLPATKLTIKGGGFGSVLQPDRKIMIDGVSLDIEYWSDERIVAQVPARGMSGDLVVEKSFEWRGSRTHVVSKPYRMISPQELDNTINNNTHIYIRSLKRQYAQ